MDAASDTVIYPSVNPNLRSSVEIHLLESSFDNFDSFVKFMSDKNNTKAITFQDYYESGGISELQKETTYLHYQIPVSFAIERHQISSNETGEITNERHLVAKLEQLTQVEQMLEKMGIEINQWEVSGGYGAYLVLSTNSNTSQLIGWFYTDVSQTVNPYLHIFCIGV